MLTGAACSPSHDDSTAKAPPPGFSFPPFIFITTEAQYAPADGISCAAFYFFGSSGPLVDPPPVSVNLGEIIGLERFQDGWRAKLCAGDRPGRVVFYPEDDTEVLFPDFYFIPAEPEVESGWTAVTAFSLDMNPQTHTAALTASDLLDGWSVELSMNLVEPVGSAFLGQIVLLAVTVSGTGSPVDLIRVRAQLDHISDPTVAVFADGRDPEPDGAPWFDYGGFFNTARALADQGAPSSWTAIWTFNLNTDAPFTVTGRVLARPPVPEDENALFRIMPYLTSRASDRVTLNWETDREARSFAVYGPTPRCDYVAAGAGERNQIDKDYSYISPPRFDSFFHRAELTGLNPDSTVYYRVIAVRDPPPAASFNTRAGPGRAFSFGVIGDPQNGHEVHSEIVARMEQFPTEFLLHTGDLVQNSNQQAEWINFFAIEASLLRNRVIYPTLGNHDVNKVNLFFRRYFDPDRDPEAPPDGKGRYYSFDYGNSHFTALDTNQSVAPGSSQHQWLVQDLSAASNNPDRKFTFVFEHLAANTAFAHAHDYYPAGMSSLQPLFNTYDVDAVFAGHVHLYERSNVNGRVHITNGGGGGSLTYEAPILALNPFYLFHNVTHHFITVRVAGDSFELQTFDRSGNLIDQVVYTKP